MPTYDYQCRKCGYKFERFQGIKEEPVKTCPECSGKVDRLISGCGLIFKGKGFYITDYKNKDSKAARSGTEKPVEKKDTPAKEAATKE